MTVPGETGGETVPDEAPDGARGAASRRRLIRSTAIFSAATGLSRVLGLVREMVATNYFGAGGLVNAFTVAFLIPNLVRALVADAALSGAFVPVFGELLQQGDRKRAWRVASTLFWLVLLGLTGITALLVLIAPLLIRPFGDAGGDPALAVALSRVLFPIVAILGVTGIVVGILNSYDHFSIPALSPVLWNVAIIVGLVIGMPMVDSASAGLYLYAGSIVAGTVMQFLLPLPWLRGLDGHLRLVCDWRDPAVRRVFKLMLPVTLSLGLINVNAAIDTLFASRLIDPELAPRAIDLAFRLYMLPQGIFSVAVTVVLFPLMARLAARKDMLGLGRAVDTGLRQIGFLLIPAAAVSAVLAEPIVRLVYQRGQFTPDQTPVVAAALAAFALGLLANGWMLLLTRAYYSLQSNWVPMAVAAGNLGLNAALDAAFYRLGVWGIPLATGVSNIAGATVLLVLLRRRVGAFGGAATALALARIAAAAAVLAAVAYGVWWGVDDIAGRSFPGQVASVGLALAVGAAAYLAACRATGVRETDLLLQLRRRPAGASPTPPEAGFPS